MNHYFIPLDYLLPQQSFLAVLPGLVHQFPLLNSLNLTCIENVKIGTHESILARKFKTICTTMQSCVCVCTCIKPHLQVHALIKNWILSQDNLLRFKVPLLQFYSNEKNSMTWKLLHMRQRLVVSLEVFNLLNCQ